MRIVIKLYLVTAALFMMYIIYVLGYFILDFGIFSEKIWKGKITEKNCQEYTIEVEGSKTKIFENCKDYNVGEEIPIKYIKGRISGGVIITNK